MNTRQRCEEDCKRLERGLKECKKALEEEKNEGRVKKGNDERKQKCERLRHRLEAKEDRLKRTPQTNADLKERAEHANTARDWKRRLPSKWKQHRLRKDTT